MAKQIAKTIKRRLALGWSSFVASKHKPARKRHVKQSRLRVSRGKVVLFKLRTFRTAKQRRSKRFRQIVLPVMFGQFREVAISLQKSAYVKSPPKTYTITVRIRPRVAANYMLILLGLTGVIVFGSRTIRPQTPVAAQQVSSFSLPTPAPVTDYTKPVFMSRSEPVQLRIPRIAVNADITSVGRLDDGTMETPNIMDPVTGWYRYSPTPGEQGPSIIVGHVDTYKGPSVFWRLHELTPGDTFTVRRKDGSVATFAVVLVKQFDQSNFPTQEVYGDVEYAGMRLITCGGTFNHKTGHYTQNTVVFAVLKET